MRSDLSKIKGLGKEQRAVQRGSLNTRGSGCERLDDTVEVRVTERGHLGFGTRGLRTKCGGKPRSRNDVALAPSIRLPTSH